MSDVYLFHTSDGGDIELIAGQPTMSDGLESAAYLSLFSGNEQDDGSDGTKRLQWWGNFDEVIESRKYRSETQALLRSIPATTGNLRLIEHAADRDLAWFVSEGLARSVEIVATMPALNTVKLAIAIVIDDREFDFVFTEAWRARNQ